MKHTTIMVTAIVAILLLFGAALYVATSSKVVLTAEEQQWLSQNENTIVVLGNPSYPPANFIDSTGKQVGITADILNRMENFLNVKFRRVNMKSWDAALQEVKQNNLAILGGITKTDDRLKHLLFTQAYITIPCMIVTGREQKENLTLGDLGGKRVAVPKSYAIEEYVKREFPNISITPVISDLEGLKKVSTGEVDVLLSDLPTISYLMETYQIPNLRIAGETGFSVNLGFAVNRNQPILNSILIKALATIPQSEKDRIKRNWITIDYNKFLFSTTFWVTIIVTFGVFLITIFGIKLWNRSLYQMVQEKTAELREYQNHLEEMVLLKTADLQTKNEELQYALDHVQQLQGILPICASCKKIRDDNGYWNQVERYFQERSDVSFSHSTCPECTKKLYGDYLSEAELESLNG